MESERESDSEKGETEEIDDGWHQHRPRTVIENWSDLTERRVKKKERIFPTRGRSSSPAVAANPLYNRLVSTCTTTRLTVEYNYRVRWRERERERKEKKRLDI